MTLTLKVTHTPRRISETGFLRNEESKGNQNNGGFWENMSRRRFHVGASLGVEKISYEKENRPEGCTCCLESYAVLQYSCVAVNWS